MNQTPVRTPVWHRILSFCLVLVLLAAIVPPTVLEVKAATKTLYFKPGVWAADNAWFMLHAWNSSKNQTYKMTDSDGDGVYEVDVDSAFTTMIVARMDPVNTNINWDNVWNRIDNISISSTYNCYQITNWSSGSWTNYTPPKYYLKGTFNDWGSDKLMTASGSTVSVTLELAAGTYTFKINVGDSWYGKTGASFKDTTSNLVLNTSGENCTINASGGTYTFTFDTSTKNLSVTFDAPAHTHSYTSTVTKEATCTEDGIRTYTCSCNHSYTETITATGHSYVNGTCTKCGITRTITLRGGFNDWSDSANVMTLSDGVYTTSVDFTAGTTQEFKLFIDGAWYSYNGTISGTTTGVKLDTSVSGNAKLSVTADGTYTFSYNDSTKMLVITFTAACEHPSHNQSGYCTECGTAVAHSYTSEVIRESTCTVAGEKKYTCSVCKYTYTEALALAPHNMVNNQCTVCGSTCAHTSHNTDGVCANCGEVVPHNLSSVVTAPTCTTPGYTTYTCSVCGLTYQDNFVDAQHAFGEGVVVAPTCTEEGYTKYTCSACDFTTYGDRKAATGHSNPLQQFNKVDSKCNVRGYIEYKCTHAGCDYTVKEYLAMGEHKYSNGVCTVCGDVKNGTYRRIYFDATYSKLKYNDAQGDYGIPNSSGTIRYYATGSGLSDTEGTMTSVNNANWPDLYYVDLLVGYTQIAFSSFDMNNINHHGWSGQSTKVQGIPNNDNLCFYADSSDMVMFISSDGNRRDGYWGKPFQVRDPKHAANRTAVEIPTGTFTPAANTMYVSTTFYDYYTDYELNGYNRKGYTDWGGDSFASQRNWVNFRHFNQALSKYYESHNVQVPIYTGHFQPHWGKNNSLAFENISDTLNLYGFKDGNAYGTDSTDQRYFMSVNNSRLEVGSDSIDHAINAAAQGIVDDQLDNGTLTTSGVAMPYFDANFINGANSKNAKLGQIYENVQFPFTQETVNGVQYWSFNSSNTTLQMTENTSQSGGYYLNSASGNQYKNLNAGSEKQDTKGFFPFNYKSSEGNANTYNYGFGARIDVEFTLTNDGMVLDNKGNKQPMVFTFSGDDDVWVFIDGELVLDIGGNHGIVGGEINFATGVAKVDKVKSSGGSRSTDNTHNFTVDTSKSNHTLTMFYMERGMWESNMSIRFNFIPKNAIMPDTTTVTAVKNWNVDKVSAKSVKVQLQRRVGNEAWSNVGSPVTLNPSSNTASHTFEDVSVYADEAQTVRFDFRVVELDASGNPLADGAEYNDLVVAYGNLEGDGNIGFTQTISNNEVIAHQVVIDYGLPVDVNVVVPGMAESVRNTGTLCGIASPDKLPIGKLRESVADPDLVTTYVSGKYGNFSVTGNKVRYTPTKMTMSEPDTIGIAIRYTHNSTTYYYYTTITVIPAANIYYEDYFLTFQNSDAASGTMGIWSAATTSSGKVQDEDRPGVDSAFDGYDVNNVYGYDPDYIGYTKHSLGATRSVTVDVTSGAKDVAPKATFTFTGTGFDVIALTDSDSGAIWVEVTDKDGNSVKSYVVNTYYGYTYNNDGEWVITPTENNALYQVPVIKVDDLDYGTYNVTIKAVYLASMDMDLAPDDFVEVEGQKVSTGSYTVWLDAIRVYNPAQGNDTAENAYQQDGESNPHFVTVKDLLVGPRSFNAGDANIGAVYVDGKSTGVTIDEYNNQGPNNETYLKNGNAIAFKLRYQGTKAPSINLQIGAKLAKGGSVTLNLNGQPLTELATATNMFYKLGNLNWTKDGNYYVSDPIVLSCSADASSILSLTDLKITGSDAAAIDEMPATSTAGTLSLVCDEGVVETARKYLASSASESEQFEINLAQAELGNALNLYFLFPADSYADWTGCYAVVTKTYADGRDDVTVTVPASEWDEKISGGKTLKRVGFHAIAAKEMGDAISISVYNANGEAISTPYSDSIVKYLTRMLEKNTDPEFRRLAVDMLVYGSAAQLQFHYNEENLAYDGLTNEQMLYGSVMLDPIFTDVRVKTETVRGTSVSLENNIVMNVFFVDQTADMTATVTFVNHNGDTINEKLTSTESKNGYCFVVDQLAVADARSVLVTVTCYDADGNVYGSVTDSVESYFARNSTSSGLDSAIVLLADSAYEYLH